MLTLALLAAQVQAQEGIYEQDPSPCYTPPASWPAETPYVYVIWWDPQNPMVWDEVDVPSVVNILNMDGGVNDVSGVTNSVVCSMACNRDWLVPQLYYVSSPGTVYTADALPLPLSFDEQDDTHFMNWRIWVQSDAPAGATGRCELITGALSGYGEDAGMRYAIKFQTNP